MPIHPLQIQLLALPKAAVLFFMKRILPLLLLVPFFFSCRPNPTRDELRRIADIVYEEPGQALAALQALDTAKTKSRSLQADYSLFKSLALTRLYTEDTAVFECIRPAERYFAKRGSAQQKAQLEYCLDMSCYPRKEWSDAIIHLRKAEVLSEECDDIFLKTIINSALANTFCITNHTESWLYYGRKTAEYAAQTGIEEFIRRSHLALASACAQNRLYDEADSLFSLGFSELQMDGVPVKELLYGASCAIGKRNNDPQLARRLYEKAFSTGDSISSEEYYKYVYSLLLLQKQTEALNLLDSLRKCRASKETDYWNYRIAKRFGDTETALSYSERFCNEAMSDLRSSINNSVFKAISEKESAAAALNSAKARTLLLVLFLLCAITFAVISCLFLLLQRNKVRHMEELDRIETVAEEANRLLSLANTHNLELISEKDILLSETQNLNKRLMNLQHSFCRSYQSRFAELGRLCEAAIPHNEKDRIRNSIISFNTDRINSLVADILSGEDKQANLEREINAGLDNVILKIRDDFPSLSDHDILFICYVAMGFEAPTIAMLYGITKNYSRVKKSRFRDLILKYIGPNRELYHTVFDRRPE